MRKALVVATVLFLLFASSSPLLAAKKLPPSLLGTQWKGPVTVVNVDGSTVDYTEAIVTFTGQADKYVNGTLSLDTNPANDITFSAILGPVDYYILHMTAPGIVMEGIIIKSGKVMKLYISGNNTVDGSTFTTPDLYGMKKQ